MGEVNWKQPEKYLLCGTKAVIFVFFVTKAKQCARCEQDSNLRGETPLDFESNALTTRPSQLWLNV